MMTKKFVSQKVRLKTPPVSGLILDVLRPKNKIIKRFPKSGLLKELCQPINDGGFSRFVQFF